MRYAGKFVRQEVVFHSAIDFLHLCLLATSHKIMVVSSYKFYHRCTVEHGISVKCRKSSGPGVRIGLGAFSGWSRTLFSCSHVSLFFVWRCAVVWIQATGGWWRLRWSPGWWGGKRSRDRWRQRRQINDVYGTRWAAPARTARWVTDDGLLAPVYLENIMAVVKIARSKQLKPNAFLCV